MRTSLILVSIIALFVIITFPYQSKCVVAKPESDGSITYIFNHGPANETTDENGKQVTKCPTTSEVECKRVNIRTSIGGGTISAGSHVCIFLHIDPQNPNIGRGYINTTIEEDYIIEEEGPLTYSLDPSQQIYITLAAWEAAVQAYNGAQ